MSYLRMEDKRNIIKECNDSAVILFEYYLSKADIDSFEYTDEKDVRLKLQKTGYYLQRSGGLRDGSIVIYLGKDSYTNREIEAKVWMQ